MKVGHITTIDLSLRYLLLNQLRYLQDAGYEVMGISAPGPYVAELEAAGIRHLAVPMTRSFTPGADSVALARLVRTIRRERFDIIHTHNPKPGLLGQVAARLAGVPLVVNTLHGFYFHDGMAARRRRFYIAVEKVAAKCSDMILSQNREDMATALAEGICRPEQIQWLGNGIDVARFDRARVPAATLEEKRRELGLAEGAPVAGFVGRLVAEKGILELLAASKQVAARVPGVRFVAIGPVDHDKADALTPAVAAEYGMADAWVFTGMRNDMPELYGLMDVFVLPSHREGFPRAPMEASAMSVPCVVTDIRGCREAVAEGRNGLRVALGDVDALAAAILRVLEDRASAQAMGARGRQLALEQFDERLVFGRVRGEYERLAAVKGLASPRRTVTRPATLDGSR
jgi:glycosyltransferase involved in cell wall biosynthesis